MFTITLWCGILNESEVFSVLKEKSPTIRVNCKLFICPVWQCDRLDSFLSNMEKNGFRLVRGSWLRLLFFQKSAPKTVRYFCTYTCLKERSMNGIEDELRSIYCAALIPTKTGGLHIHRITDTTTDLKELEELRWISMSRIILERLSFSIVFMVGVICVFVSAHLGILTRLAVVGLISIFVYYLIGLVVVKKKTIIKKAP